jgi:hypothetical protein
VGLGLVVIGLTGSAAAVEHWGRLGFGHLDPRGTIRLVLPSAALVALGVLWIFRGFVGSLLTLRGVHPEPLPDEPARVREPARGFTRSPG